MRSGSTGAAGPETLFGMNLQSLLMTAAAMSFSGAAAAATISYVGSVESNQVNEWRTSSFVKSMDIDGNNVYGTHGAVHWTKVGVNEFGAGSASPGWHYAGETGAGQFGNPAYAAIDLASDPNTTTNAGIAAVAGTFTFELTGDASTYVNKIVRIGIMADVLSAAEWSADINKTFQVTQLTGGLGDSGTISLRGGAAGNGQPEMYFFDVAGANPGDTFRIIAGTTSGPQPGYIGPVSWDVAPVPEPGVIGLAALAGVGLVRCRRRLS